MKTRIKWNDGMSFLAESGSFRRGADSEKEPSGYQRLRGGNRGGTGSARTQGIHPYSFPFYPDRQKAESPTSGAGDHSFRGKILLSFDNAGKNGETDTRL